jgi:hypothetical protein
LIFPFTWDLSRHGQDISLGSREISQYSPYYYSYFKALQKLGKNSIYNDDRRRVKNMSSLGSEAVSTGSFSKNIKT